MLPNRFKVVKLQTKKRDREQALVQEMFDNPQLDDFQDKRVRNILQPLLDTYFALDCHKEEHEDL